MSAKKKETPEVPKVEAPAKSVDRKIEIGELIQLQKEGRLTSYNPSTGMGTVKAKGSKVLWPGGDPKAA